MKHIEAFLSSFASSHIQAYSLKLSKMNLFSRRNAKARAPAPNYNNPTVPDAQTYKKPPAPAAQNYNQAPVPAAQNYNQDPIPSAKNYHTTPIPDSQNYKDEHRHSSKTSGDSMLTNQILASDRSHARPDDDVTLLPLKNILQTVDVILSRITRPDIHGIVTGAPVASAPDALEHEKTIHATMSSLHDNYDVPTSLFNAISSEIFRNWLSGEDANKTAMDVLDIVKHYDWDEKVVLALGTFAVKYGEYWLVAHLYPTNPLAKAVGQLKQVQEILERAGTSLKPKFDAYDNLVRAVLNVTKCIVQLHELQRDPHLTTEAELADNSDNSDNSVRAVHNALIPTAVYWTIRSIVVAALQLLGITGMGSEYVIDTWELLTLAQKLENIHSDLKENLDRLHDIIHDIIKRKQDDEALASIANILEKSHIDNTESLRVLFSNDDRPALYDCHNKNDVVDIDVLKWKVMILFLSDLDVVHKNEYMIVQQMYMEKQQNPTRSQYEVVWIPIVDTLTGVEYQQFEELRRNMEWYTVVNPSVVSQTVIRYIRKQDKWNYAEKPLLVVMDYDGKIVNTNAVLMMCVWGNNAFPFTSDRERVPWEEKTHWRMELLADAIDPNLVTWIKKNKYICLYGGVDINWIRNFTRSAKNVARAAGIQLELLYVGKREPDNAVREIINVIKTEDLSHTLEWDFIRFFWVRLESMWQSKGQLMKPEDFRSRIFWNANMKNDVVMQGIISVLTFGSSNLVWAVIDDGLSAMAKASGEHMHTSLKEFNLWNKRATALGFVPALKERLASGHKETPHPCPHLWLPPIELMAGITVRAQCCPNMVKISVHKEID